MHPVRTSFHRSLAHASFQARQPRHRDAAFGQVSWKATDALMIQPGVRTNDDTKTGSYHSLVTGTASTSTRLQVTFNGLFANDPWIVAQRGVPARAGRRHHGDGQPGAWSAPRSRRDEHGELRHFGTQVAWHLELGVFLWLRVQ